ncbi:uncharacterized protein METZ01_LOCUS361830 [marine metagenome]|uniref:Uncharacterized protein n=1 Tax=marine metagenome TaxID=408172 RepID=A0A382SGJ3_9ZZZZ
MSTGKNNWLRQNLYNGSKEEIQTGIKIYRTGKASGPLQ